MKQRLLSWARSAKRRLAGTPASKTQVKLPADKAETGKAQIVEVAYSARQAAGDNLQQLSAALRNFSIEHAVLPSVTVFNRIVVVPQESAELLLQALGTLDGDHGWNYRIERQPVLDSPLSPDNSDAGQEEVSEVTVSRSFAAPQGLKLSTNLERIRIQLWQRLPEGVDRHDGGMYEPGTLLSSDAHRGKEVSYLSPDKWEAAQKRADHHFEFDHPLLREVTEPIDMVYTWVDGSDPAWLQRKAESMTGGDSTPHHMAANSSRFTSHDELRYSLRSVEMYADWVRHIYIVTDQQTPRWLDTSHPKITMVDHRDIFTDTSVLPVFNSRALESQVHHIPGLSEHYLFMNDDVFFARPTNPSLFVMSNGLAKFFPSPKTLDASERMPHDSPFMAASKNGRDFIAEQHGLTATRKFLHTPRVQSRSVLEDLERQFPDMFANVAASKFRHVDDVAMASVQHNHAFALGKAIPSGIKFRYVDIGAEDVEERYEGLKTAALDVFCLNDTDTAEENRESAANLLAAFLEHRFKSEAKRA